MRNGKQAVDLLVMNGDLFTGDKDRPHLRPGALAIDAGTISAVGTDAEISLKFESARTIDAQGAIMHPGFIDTHFHLMSMPFHGLPIDPDGRSATKIGYSLVKTEADGEAISAFAAAAAVALLRRGFTLLLEPGTVFETDAFVDSLTRCGMRGLVSAPYGWDDVSTFLELMPGTMSAKLLDRAPANAARVVDQCKKELKRNEDENTLVRGFVCLYGEGSGSDELVRACAALARDHDVIFNQHQGYIPLYAQAEQKKFGASGVSRLRRLDALGAGTTLTHMNVLSPEDADLVTSSNTGVVWCPTQALHRGLHPANRCYHPSFYKAGVNVSLGVDTILHYPLGSAGLASLFLSGSVGERLSESDPFYMQTIVAAKTIGLSDRLGSVSVGKRADIVIRSAGDISHTALDDLGSVLGTSSSMMPVDTVIVDGQVIMENGRLTTMDEEKIMAAAIEHRKKILQKVTT